MLRHLCLLSLALGPATTDAADRPLAPAPRAAEPVERMFGVGSKLPAIKPVREDEIGERACIKSYPWPWGTFDQDKIARFTSADMKKLHDDLESVSVRIQARDPDLTTDLKDRTSYERRLVGYTNLNDLEQQRLFGDYLYITWLRRESRFDDAVKFAASVAAKRDLTPRPREPDSAEKSTYFHRQTLRNMIWVASLDCRARQRKLDLTALTEAAVECLEKADVIRSLMGLNTPGEPPSYADPTIQVLSRLISAAPLLSVGGPLHERQTAAADAPVIAGVMRRADGSDVLFLRGSRVHAVVLDRRTFRGKVLSPEDAAETFREYVADTNKALARAGFCPIHVVAGANSWQVTVGNRPAVALTAAELAPPPKGQQLPAGHPLRAALGDFGTATLVRWSDPFQQLPGPHADGAAAFDDAVRAALPGVRFAHLADPAAGAGVSDLAALKLAGAKELDVVVARDSFPAADRAAIGELAAALGKAGCRVTEWTPRAQPPAGAKGRAVLVLAGHEATASAEFFRQLAVDGWLAGRAVIYGGAGNALTPERAGGLASRSEAIAVFALGSAATRDQLSKWATALTDRLTAAPKTPLDEVVVTATAGAGLSGGWTVGLRKQVP